MIIDLDCAYGSASEPRRSPHGDSQFANVMAQYTPLFSPWPAAEQSIRASTTIPGAALNSHPTASNRREGRHARG